MHLRKVTKEGRVNIPVEFLRQFHIEENEFVEVTTTDSAILIKKAVPKNICAITGRITKESELKLIGNAYISLEGIKLLQEYLNDQI